MFPPRDSSSEPVPVGVAVVLRSAAGGADWILVSHRFPDAHLPDFWEFPGGKILPGESAGECARREVEEETGVQVRVRRSLLKRAFRYPDRSVEVEFFLCDYLGGIPQPIGCRAVRWVRPENLDCYQFPGANLPVLRAMRAQGLLRRRAGA